MSETSILKKPPSGGKRYCVMCKSHQNQIHEDGTKITLHRLPGGKTNSEIQRRKTWIRCLKLHRPNMPITDNTRVCVLHFEGHIYKHGESVPKYCDLKKIPTAKSRRPLTEKFQNCVSDSSKINQSEQSDELFETVIDEDDLTSELIMLETFEDNLENCATVEIATVQPHCIEIDSCTPLSDSVENDHDYVSNKPVFNATINSETQTEPIPKQTMKPEDIENNDEKTRFYTGFANYATFLLIFQTLINHGGDRLTYWEGQGRSLGGDERRYNDSSIGKPGRKRLLRPLDEFYMVCLRLRLGMLQEHLKDAFGVSIMTVSRIMNTWINFMYDNMKGLIPWPSRDQILANLPQSFSDMPQVRIVIDATEFFCEKPSSLIAQNLTWSEYKHHNTFKVLIGVAPNGLVTFISRVWGGHTSDRHIVQKDGDMIIPKLEPGDVIQADKGFTVADLLPPTIGLNMPPFVSKCKMTKSQFFKTQQIASSRIVVEMKMEQIKNFRVLQMVLPLTEAHLAEQIIVICTAMTNLYEPLLK